MRSRKKRVKQGVGALAGGDDTVSILNIQHTQTHTAFLHYPLIPYYHIHSLQQRFSVFIAQR